MTPDTPPPLPSLPDLPPIDEAAEAEIAEILANANSVWQDIESALVDRIEGGDR